MGKIKPQKPTLAQKRIIGDDWNDYLVVSETDKELVCVHKESNKTQTFAKRGRKRS